MFYKKKQFRDILSTYFRVLKILSRIDIKIFFLIFFLSILSGIAPIISVNFLQSIINMIHTLYFPMKDLIVILFLYTVFNLFVAAIILINQYLLSILQYKIDQYVENMILIKSGSLNLLDFEDSESNNKIQRAQNSNRLYNYFSYSVMIVNSFVTLIFSFFVMLTWRWWSVILICSVYFLITILRNKLSVSQYNMIRKRTNIEREKWYYKFLLTKDIAFKEIKLYNLTPFFINKFNFIYNTILSQDLVFLKKSTLVFFFVSFLEEVSMTFFFACVIFDAYFGRLLIGDTFAYIKTISNIKLAMKNISQQFSGIYKDNLYTKQFFEFIDMSDVSLDKCRSKGNITIKKIKQIKIENLSFRYKNSNKFALKNLNLTISTGEVIAIVGRNGSGKSTLVKILTGLYDNYDGKIYVNGIDIREINKNSYQNEIGILFQDFTKFELSLRENIAISDIFNINNDVKIKQSLAKSNFSKFSDNLNIRLGFWFENGTQLSGGEWMKVGLARAFFRPSSLLIFDEPDSSLDSISEKKFFEKIVENSGNKIGIVITHRMSSLSTFTKKILLLKEGKQIAFDTHEKLINQCPEYLELYKSDSICDT